MFETTKAMKRRLSDSRFITRWLVGDAIDIGAGNDPLSNHQRLFPALRSVRNWDKEDGDAMLMRGVADESFDVVHSSHCLEHLNDPAIALGNWIRICRAGGHLVIIVPDEDLYEQGVFPSTFNDDHKWTFTIGKTRSWSPRSLNVVDQLRPFFGAAEVLKIELLDAGFIYGMERFDQTKGIMAESGIEIVLKKR